MSFNAKWLADRGSKTEKRLSFARLIAESNARGQLVVQPRMGFASIEKMRNGLLATKHAKACSVGTITIDSYTRVGDERAARRALLSGSELNGYPITSYAASQTRGILEDVCDHLFSVQVRHGSASPQHIFRSLVDVGINATEGGPVSYCLPYGRTPLVESVRNWRECCELLATRSSVFDEPHIETFGGCMLGQLCPPGLLVAISVLEAMFFRESGIQSVSLSYAQQTNFAQDQEAIAALRRLATELLGDCDWHVVLYTYMGMFPRSVKGATLLLKDSVRLAVRSGVSRLLVKTTAEAHSIPTIVENTQALEVAAATAAEPVGVLSYESVAGADSQVYQEAYALIEAVLNLDSDLGKAFIRAFSKGILDVPYCLHPNNAAKSRSCIDKDGWLMWSDIANMPIKQSAAVCGSQRMSAEQLLEALSFVQNRFDGMRDSVAETSMPESM